MKLKVAGLKELIAQLKDLQPALKSSKALSKAMRKAMKPVLAAAQARVPVDTGLLQRSIKIASVEEGDIVASGLRIATGKGGGGKDIAAAGRAAVEGKGGKARKAAGRLSAHWRWHFIEKGVPAHGIAAKPFLRPALDNNAQAALDIIAKELDAAIAKEVRKTARTSKQAILNTIYAGTK